MYGDLYFDGVHESERGFFGVIMSTAVDGNFADVYGETREQAEIITRQMITLINIGQHFLDKGESVKKLTALYILFRDTTLIGFETAHEVAIFLWGRKIEKWNILKNGELVQLPTLTILEIEKLLDEA